MQIPITMAEETHKTYWHKVTFYSINAPSACLSLSCFCPLLSVILMEIKTTWLVITKKNMHIQKTEKNMADITSRDRQCYTQDLHSTVKYIQTSCIWTAELEYNTLVDGTGHSASTSTPGPISRTAGARMKTPRNVSGPPSLHASSGTGSSASKLWICGHYSVRLFWKKKES